MMSSSLLLWLLSSSSVLLCFFLLHLGLSSRCAIRSDGEDDESDGGVSSSESSSLLSLRLSSSLLELDELTSAWCWLLPLLLMLMSFEIAADDDVADNH